MAVLFILWQMHCGAQNFILADTSKIIPHLVEPNDSLIKNRAIPIDIVDYDGLRQYLKPLGQHNHPGFDFSKQYISLQYRCLQCIKTCRHSNDALHEPCHRNRCLYSPCWLLKNRPNTHAINYERVNIKGISPWLYKPTRQDTLIIHQKNKHLPLPPNAPEYIYLHGILGGDCHARFTYELFQDDDKKTVTWIMHNLYGGCRAGYYGEVYLRMKNPGEGYRFIFNVVLETEITAIRLYNTVFIKH